MGLIRSPDGRVWKLDRLRPKLREAETFKVPFFWSSVVATIVLLAFIARVVWVDRSALAYVFLVPFAVWIVERRIQEAIEAGRPEADVKGAPLVRSG